MALRIAVNERAASQLPAATRSRLQQAPIKGEFLRLAKDAHWSRKELVVAAAKARRGQSAAVANERVALIRQKEAALISVQKLRLENKGKRAELQRALQLRLVATAEGRRLERVAALRAEATAEARLGLERRAEAASARRSAQLSHIKMVAACLGSSRVKAAKAALAKHAWQRSGALGAAQADAAQRREALAAAKADALFAACTRRAMAKARAAANAEPLVLKVPDVPVASHPASPEALSPARPGSASPDSHQHQHLPMMHHQQRRISKHEADQKAAEARRAAAAASLAAERAAHAAGRKARVEFELRCQAAESAALAMRTAMKMVEAGHRRRELLAAPNRMALLSPRPNVTLSAIAC